MRHRPLPSVGDGHDLAGLLGLLIHRQERLCCGLEDLADSLPRPDTQAALSMTSRLQPALRRAHWLEEGLVFPALAATRADLAPTLDRLRGEHREDEHHAADLHEAMAGFVARSASRRAEAQAEEIGYMLRGLFVGLRRHAAFERDCLLPICAGCRAP